MRIRQHLMLLLLWAVGSATAMPLQPLAERPGKLSVPGVRGKVWYVPSTLSTIKWGYLPNQLDAPVLQVPSGAMVVFDTVSHEGLLEDQGRDALKYFSSKGVAPNMVLNDAIAITRSSLPHDFVKDGPHIVTGPIAIQGAQPGDVLKVEILAVTPRVPYGVISNRHGKGALPGEMPEGPPPESDASAAQPEKFHNVSVFTPIRKDKHGRWIGVMKNMQGKEVTFATAPFMGVMGVAAATDQPVHSVPPGVYGGNMDVKDLGAGTTVYLPVFVEGANFYTGDPHMVQANGEVALTALEHSMRATFRFTLLKQGDPRIPSASGSLEKPFGETRDYWIAIGLNPDLDEAMKDAVREALRFLTEKLGMDRAVAYAYLSAATDFNVSQVVDRTKGIHALIRKRDFSKIKKIAPR
ncbi:MAG: acetamidase/formamidase family protein [Burkholderiales bacterium]|nr:acetamidase/formamidase family protein [Burkholderiales bacterium]